LNDLRTKKEGSLVSAIGIVVREDELKDVTPKYKSPIKLKNFYICDQTCDDIKVSLWGKQAETFSCVKGDMFAFTRVKLSIYNGVVGLSVLLESTITRVEENMNEIALSHELRRWWQERTVYDLCQKLKRSNTADDIGDKKLKENYMIE